MASKITMPKLSDTMTEGVLLKWLKKEGESVEAGEVIAEAESDKATMELEAFDAGTLLKIIVAEGGKVAVGGTLAIIGEKGEDISALLKSKSPEQSQEEAPVVKAEEKPIHSAPIPDKAAKDEIITSGSARIKVSPLARKIATERGIDLRQVEGSGTGGRIIKRDLDTVIAKSGAATQPQKLSAKERPGSEEKLNTMRTAIAQRMTLSKTTVPHFYLTVEVDMDKAIALRQDLNAAQEEVKISFTDLIVKVAAMTLLDHPRVNGSFADDRFILHGPIDIGLAVALEDGLITPVIRHCEQKSLLQIAKEARVLADKAKGRKLTPEEYSGATFTISNLGMYDIEEFSAIINPPEAAILAVSAIVEKPVVRDGQIVIGNRMKMTLSCDHRIIDGAAGAVFLRDLVKNLQNPVKVLL
ncbi:2-oxo acid dehydrogenase subunit E2 [candidate division KSB1 bacterium]|nr:2-oxo acid dehydrogenase subunit E2 [candidate division KSB1 bacterium]